jgi:predicted RNase H-like HicB family nuclease
MIGTMPTRVSLTAVYEPVENGWIQARIAELPGVITAAPTLEEAKDLLVDALREYLLGLQDDKGERLDGGAARGSIEVTIEAA